MISLSTDNWKIDNVETILFDKDGTFIDLHYFWGKMTELRVLEVIKRFSLEDSIFEKLCLCLGYDTQEGKMLSDGITAMYSRVKIIEIFKNDLLNIGINVSNKEIEDIFDNVSEQFYKEIENYTKPITSAIEFIKKAHDNKIKIGIVTSDSIHSTKLTLKQFEWDYLFNAIVGRESSPHTKESGEPTKLALNQLNANPKTTVMIGDAPMDYISAKNAGIINTILVATGQINSKELSKTSKYVIENLSQISIITDG